MAAPRLFVSHSHHDSAFTRRLVADLRERLGVDAVWMDEVRGLHGGDEWWRTIVAEITDRDTFLVVLSPNALTSKWVPQEMSIAYHQYVQRGKKLRPLLLEACDLRADWQLLQAIDFTEQASRAGSSAYMTRLEELLATVGGRQKMPPAASAVKPVPPAILQLVQDVQAAFGLQDWQIVVEKTDALRWFAPDALTAALWQERGMALLALHDSVQALEALEQALSQEPHDIATLQAKGSALLAVNREQEAVQTLQLALSLVPYKDRALRLRVLSDFIEALCRARMWTEALRRAEEGTRLAPDETVWQQRVQSIRLQVRYNEAMQAQNWAVAQAVCDEALQLAPTDKDWQHRETKVVRQRLTDGSYLLEKIRRAGLEAVLGEFSLQGHDETLHTIAVALRCSSVVLRQAPEEVWNQVHGRGGMTLQAGQARAIPRFDLRFATLLPADEALLHILEGHTGWVMGCALSADGKLALSASYDNTLRVWEVSSGREICRWSIDAAILCCAFGPDGKTVVAGDAVRSFHFLSLVMQ